MRLVLGVKQVLVDVVAGRAIFKVLVAHLDKNFAQSLVESGLLALATLPQLISLAIRQIEAPLVAEEVIALRMLIQHVVESE